MKSSGFPFPSNGKVVPNGDKYINYMCPTCEFQFPSNGKVVQNQALKLELVAFNTKFRFPSNGIVFPNSGCVGSNTEHRCKVSIPFQRESSSELTYADGHVWFIEFRFPSNGKVVQNMLNFTYTPINGNGFRFPSNGKVVPNLE